MFKNNKKSLIILIFSCTLALFIMCILLKSLVLNKENNSSNVFKINANIKVEKFIKERYILNRDLKIDIGKIKKKLKMVI